MTIQTYAEVLKDYVELPRRGDFLRPSRILWLGERNEQLVGVVAHDLLRFFGVIMAYKTVGVNFEGYNFQAYANSLHILTDRYSLPDTRDQDCGSLEGIQEVDEIVEQSSVLIFRSSYGAATRTMTVLESNLRRMDIERFNYFATQIIRGQISAIGLTSQIGKLAQRKHCNSSNQPVIRPQFRY